jgi:RsiW-degrading membrane proteinase PrsW (M82 family)
MLQPEMIGIALAAVAPALVLAAVAFAVVRPDARAAAGVGVGFLWGAVVASTLAAALNDAAVARLPALLGDARTRDLVPVLVGPVVEEVAKALGLVAVALVARRLLGGIRGAIGAGAAIGLGFAAAENVGYYVLAAVQGGADALGRAVWTRGVLQAGNHAAFTAVTAAALAWAATRPRRWRAAVALGGLATAVALHALWNAVVSRALVAVLCNAPAPGAACAPAPDASDLLLAVPALEAAFLLPILAALRRLARRGT